MGIKILSYNVHWGLSTFKRVNVTESLATFIHKTHADIILLQELWLPKGELEFILTQTLCEVWPYQACVPTCILPAGNQGNGILSRHKILEWKQIDLSYSKEQERSFIHARLLIEEEARVVSVICTHFGLRRSERHHQADVLLDYVMKEIAPDEALVLGGDFNDWLGEMTKLFRKKWELFEVFKESYGHHARTYPAIYPLFALDRIYVRNLKFDKAEVVTGAGWRGSSDHLPLAVELTF